MMMTKIMVMEMVVDRMRDIGGAALEDCSVSMNCRGFLWAGNTDPDRNTSYE